MALEAEPRAVSPSISAVASRKSCAKLSAMPSTPRLVRKTSKESCTLLRPIDATDPLQEAQAPKGQVSSAALISGPAGLASFDGPAVDATRAAFEVDGRGRSERPRRIGRGAPPQLLALSPTALHGLSSAAKDSASAVRRRRMRHWSWSSSTLRTNGPWVGSFFSDATSSLVFFLITLIGSNGTRCMDLCVGPPSSDGLPFSSDFDTSVYCITSTGGWYRSPNCVG
mmetsp:Transcript_31112/g.78728  ORF Transcript_31112/g.78728 Transcript_31112/m.78728 type:complete len:226 (+) Transcript_31112:1582-2259(+)